MKVADLIAQLEGLNPNAEVVIAYQPNYPLTNSIEDNIGLSEDEMTVYLGESGSKGNKYLNEDICEQLWR